MKNSKMLLWAFIVSACITIVQFAMVAMGAGEVAWIGVVGVAALTVITVYMHRPEGPSIVLAMFSVAGLILGGVFQLAGKEGVLFAAAALVVALFVESRALTMRSRLDGAQGLMLMLGMIIGWQVSATWTLILLVSWVWALFQEHRRAARCALPTASTGT